MKQGIIAFLVGVIFANYVSAQTAIKGIINSKGEPVAYAAVVLIGSNFGTTTNQNGAFEISNLPPGTYNLRVSMVGFERYNTKVLVEPNKILTLNINLKSLENNLNEVTISGTLKDITRSESPVPVEIYSHKFFAKNPTSNLFEAVQMINGVQPTLNCNVCNTGDIHINGLEGPYTMVLIDGMPIVSSLGTVYGLMGIPNSLIEKVEVVKGPASTLYGSEAVAGLINIITKNTDKAPKFAADIFTTSYLEHNFDFGLSKRYKNASTLLSANYFNFNHRWDVNNDNFTDVTLQNRISVFNKWQFKRKNNLSASLAGRFFYEDRFGGEMQWQPEHRGGDSVYGESIYTKRAELLGNYPFLLANQPMRFMFSYIYHDQNSVYGTTKYLATQQIGFGQFLYDKKLNYKNDFLAGLSLRYNYYDDNSPATFSADVTQPKNQPSINYLPGLFVQNQTAINSNNTLLLGLRYDYYKEHGNIFSPRFNYKFSPTRHQTFRLSAGNGFRVVNLFTEDHAALSGARTVIVKNNLQPEQSWNVNLNYNHFLNTKQGFITFDASVFYTYFNNKIVADFDTDPNLIIYDNLQEHAISKGITFNTDMQFVFPLKVNAGITLMNVFTVVSDSLGQTKNVQQLHAPKFMGTWQIGYTFNQIKLTIDYTGQVYGPMRLPILPNDFRPEYSPWFAQQNMQLTKKFNTKIEVYGGVKNLFNFLPSNPIMRPFDPFDKQANNPVTNPNNFTFDPTYNFAPMMARRFFVGLRYSTK